jgi:Reverse transcriptase (RNA-dependent DNA polymerase)
VPRHHSAKFPHFAESSIRVPTPQSIAPKTGPRPHPSQPTFDVTPTQIDFDSVSEPEPVSSPQLVRPREDSHSPAVPVVSGHERRGSRVRTKNPKFFDKDKWINFQSGSLVRQKIRSSILNDAFVQCLKWDQDKTEIMSKDYQAFLGAVDCFEDYEEGTVEYQHPLQMKANAEDNPTWDQAMNGPDQAGYWKAMETELATLEEKKNSWEVVERETWMNVLPSTWAFRCKRFPDGTVRKLKARFCVRGDKQKEGVDYFDTFAPVVSWQTVRLMLVLSIILNLSTKQVDYTAAFVHAPIDIPPNFDKMTDEEKRKIGVFVQMPRGFSQYNKVLKLNKSLYGLKQAPRNFFLHLKSKLESIGFVSQQDLDPCLFISDKVICLVYVDDTLFYSAKAEFIDDVIERLRAVEMDLEVEGEVAGFFGEHIQRNTAESEITFTQTGLIKRIIEAVGVTHLPAKSTPADFVPLVKDLDGDPIDGTFNYSRLLACYNIYKITLGQTLPTQSASVPDLCILQENHTKMQ